MSDLISTHALLAPEAQHPQRSDLCIERVGETAASAGFNPGLERAADLTETSVSGFAEAREASAAGMADDELDALMNPTGFQTEVVIGFDDRIRISPANRWPWAVHGHMEMTFPDGRRFIGSGTMINRHHVLTAGHCVFSRDNGGWATEVIFQAARDDGALPFGTSSAVRLLSVAGWTNGENPEFDMGMLILGDELGERTGWHGIVTGPEAMLSNHRVNVSGYPGDKGGRTLWTHKDVIKSVTDTKVFYDIDTAGGQSGSGVWSVWDGHAGEKVCAIHTTGSQSGNGAVRIDRDKFDRIIGWMARH